MADGHRRGHADDEHEEHVNHEAWVIPYADMLTLLMALFLVLFAVGRVDAEKFEKLAASLHESIEGGGGEAAPSAAPSMAGESSGSDGVLDGGAAPGAGSDLLERARRAVAARRARSAAVDAQLDTLAGVRGLVQSAADARGLGESVGFRLEARGLVVSITTDQVLFSSGDATLQPAGSAILDVLADALREAPYHLSVEGHTDARPLAPTSPFATNWELSTARATTVLRYLIDRHGIVPTRLSATGYADTRPASTDTSAGGQARNRRVEVVVLSTIELPVPAT